MTLQAPSSPSVSFHHHTPPRPTFTALLAVLAVLGAGACADLPPIDDGVCGNHVTDGAEDCDENTAACHPPGHAQQCRFACEPNSEELYNDGCPDTHQCGVDKVCRQGTGRFLIAEEVLGGTVAELATARFDNDGRDDVFHASFDVSTARYFGDAATTTASAAIARAAEGPAPMLGDLDGDGNDDLVFGVRYGVEFGSGLAVYTAQDDRTLASQTYVTLPMPFSAMRAIRLNVLPPTTRDEVVAFAKLGAAHVVVGLGDDRQQQAMGLVPGLKTEDIVGVAVGQLIDNSQSPCDEIAVVTKGQSTLVDRVWIVEPCKWNVVQEKPEWNGSVNPIEILLPATETVWTWKLHHLLPDLYSSLHVGYVDVDEYLDLLLVAQGEGDFPGALLIAFGRGDGHFASDRQDPGYDDTFGELDTGYVKAPTQCLPLGALLAVADFNQDGRDDLVVAQAILLSHTATPSEPWLWEADECEQAWTSAVVGDFDRNGTMDVVATRKNEDDDLDEVFAPATGLDHRVGAGDGSFAHSSIPTDGPVLWVGAGDFDGDLVTDVSFVQLTDDVVEADIDGAVRQADTIHAAFGRTFGGFDTPVRLGALHQVEQLVTGRVAGGDSTSDILLLSRGAEDDNGDSKLGMAIVGGNANRQLVSPFSFSVSDTVPLLTEVRALAFGDLADPANAAVNSAFAALTMDDFGTTGSGGKRHRVWLVQQRGDDMELDAQHASAFDHKFACDRCILTAVDLDQLSDSGEELDEVLVLGNQTYASGATGEIGVLEAVEEDGKRVLVPRGEPIDAPFTFVDRDEADRSVQPLVHDVDLDTIPDVIALAVQKPYYPGDPIGLVILWNDETGTIDVDQAAFVFEANNTVTGFAVLNADADPALEIVVSIDEGAVVLDVDPITRTVTSIADGKTRLLQGWLDGEAWNLWPDLLTAGDFDGDGVDDLFLGDYFGHILLKGEAVKP